MLVMVFVVVVMQVFAMLNGGDCCGTNTALRLHAGRKIGFCCHV